MYIFSIIMFAMTAALLLYAALLGGTKDHRLIFRNQSAQMRDPKRYAVQFAKGIAVLAGLCAVCGVLGLFQWYMAAALVGGIGFIAALVVIAKLVDGA
ncbi:MAG: hypothetical protein IKN55_12215 [Oscillospiraceae bacterium]|nr:hypothetical protein [Oscillospiraceae bacterium]